jgi:hypothetical protein
MTNRNTRTAGQDATSSIRAPQAGRWAAGASSASPRRPRPRPATPGHPAKGLPCDHGNRAVPLLRGHQRCAIHTRPAQSPGVDVHSVPDGLGDHRRQPAASLRPPRRDRRAARCDTFGPAASDHTGRRRGHAPGQGVAGPAGGAGRQGQAALLSRLIRRDQANHVPPTYMKARPMNGSGQPAAALALGDHPRVYLL